MVIYNCKEGWEMYLSKSGIIVFFFLLKGRRGKWILFSKEFVKEGSGFIVLRELSGKFGKGYLKEM